MTDIRQIYLDGDRRDQTIKSLITFGAEVFKAAYEIENLNSTIDFLSEHERNPRSQQEVWAFFKPFVYNRLIDDVRILACFENVLKAELIYKGFFVHELRNEKKKAQKKSPIKFQGISDIDKFMLGEFTLSISTIVRKENYFHQLSISPSIRSALDKIIDDRNRLHLLESLNTSYSLERATQLKEMKTYIDGMIEKLKNKALNIT